MLNQGQVARIKAERLNKILAPYGIEAVSYDWGTQTYHLRNGLIRQEGLDLFLKGQFFEKIDIGRGSRVNNSLSYNFLESPYIVWEGEGQTPRITNLTSFLNSIEEKFVRNSNCGFLPEEVITAVKFTSPIAGELARKMFPHLIDDIKTPCSQWQGKHHKAFAELFPATYVGCRRVTQNNFAIILYNKEYGEFEVSSSIL